jgi:hypothetical protein
VPIKTENGLHDVSADANEVNLASLEVLNWVPSNYSWDSSEVLFRLLCGRRSECCRASDTMPKLGGRRNCNGWSM